MKPKMIIWDFDDTLFHWTKHFIKWLFENKLSEIDIHDTATWFTRDFVYEFNNSKHFIRRDPICDNLDLFGFTLRSRNYCDVKILSACGKGLNEKIAKILLMKCYLWDYRGDDFQSIIECENNSQDKYKHLLEHAKTHELLVIDDKQETVRFCRENGILAVCNKDFNNLRKIISLFLTQDADFIDKHPDLI